MRENLVLNYQIYFKPMKRLETMSDMMTFCNSSDGRGSIIENKLKTVNSSSWKIKQKRVAIADKINVGLLREMRNTPLRSGVNKCF